MGEVRGSLKRQVNLTQASKGIRKLQPEGPRSASLTASSVVCQAL